MFRLSILRASSYLLAVITLICVWYYSDIGATIVNQSLRVTTSVIKGAARVVASFANSSPVQAEKLAVDGLGMHRALLVGFLMLAWLFVITSFAHRHPLWHVRRALLALVIIKVTLLAAWIYIPDPVSAVYQAHEDLLQGVLDNVSAPRLQTFLTELKLHGLLIIWELIVIYSLLLAAIERASERRYAAWTSLGR